MAQQQSKSHYTPPPSTPLTVPAPAPCTVRYPSELGSALRFPPARVAQALQSWGFPQTLGSARLSSAAAAEKAACGCGPAVAPSSPAPGALRAPRGGTEESSGSAPGGAPRAKCLLQPVPLRSFQRSRPILEDAQRPSAHAGCREQNSTGRWEGESSELDGGNLTLPRTSPSYIPRLPKST